jgi:hypothetical protein
MRTNKIFSVFMMTVLMAPAAVAQSPAYHETSDYQGTEAALLTPWTVFENSIRSYAGPRKKFEQNVETSTLNIGPYRWILSGLNWKVVSEFETNDVTENQVNLSSKNLQIQVQISKASIDQYIEQVVNGAILRVRVQAECGPLTLVQNAAQAEGTIHYEFNSRNILAQLDQFDLQWADGSWSVSSINCKGPTGFAETLQQELTSRLRSAQEVRPFIHDFLKQKVQSEVAELVENLKTPKVLPIPKQVLPLTVSFLKFEARDEGLVTRAQLVWGSSKEARVRAFAVASWPSQVSNTKPTLLIPQAGLGDYISANVAAQPDWQRGNLRQVEFFKKVIGSRFVQFFVWPDLFNYSKTSSPFYLTAARPSYFAMNWNKDGSAAVSIATKAWIQSYRDNQWWNYVLVEGTASGVLAPSIVDGRFKVLARLNRSQIDTRFGEDYVRTYNPNTYIANGTLNSVVSEVGKSYEYEAALPDLNLGLLGTARAQAWKSLGNGAIAVPFIVKTPNQN